MPRATSASSRSQPRRKRREEIAFSFLADRFGYRDDDRQSTPAEAKALVEALRYWAETIQQLFGDDTDGALRSAVEAGILPTAPAWSRTDAAAALVERQLGGEVPPALDEPGPAMGEAQPVQDEPGPGGDTRQKDDGGNAPEAEGLNQSSREALDEVRQYLLMLGTWWPAFEAGAWAAAIAALGARGQRGPERRHQGLYTLMRVLGRIAAPQPGSVDPRLYAAMTALPVGVAAVAKLAPSAQPSYDSFADRPAELRKWCERLRGFAQDISLDEREWTELQRLFWAQWSWSASGPPGRDPKLPAVSAPDLVHAARHGGLPVVPPVGGNLSTGEWSRILALAASGEEIPPVALNTALGNLGLAGKSAAFEQLVGPNSPAAPVTDVFAAILPASARSQAWSWQPQPGVPAVALMPPEIANLDRPGVSGPDPLLPLIDRTAAASTVTPQLLLLVEIPTSSMSKTEIGALTDSLRRARGRSEFVFFGQNAPPAGVLPYVQGPRNLGDLIERALAKVRAEPRSSWWIRLWRRIWRGRLPAGSNAGRPDRQ